MKIVLKAVGLVLVLGGVAAYKLDLWQPLVEAVQPTAIAAAAAPSPEEVAMNAKLEPFIDCINGVDSAWRERYPQYTQAYGVFLKGGPAPSILGRFYLTMAGDRYAGAKTCLHALEQAVDATPADATLDAAGRVYVNTLSDLLPRVMAIDEYYQQQDYRDDNKARGRTLHAEIVPLFDTLFAASDDMRDVISARNLARQRKALDEMARVSGQDIWWHSENIMLQARVAVDGIEREMAAEAPSREALQALETTYTEAYDAAKAYGDAHRESLVKNTGLDPFWYALERHATTLLGNIKTVRRNVAEKPSKVSPRDLESVITAFNGLVEEYNRRIAMRRTYERSMR